MIVIAVSNIHEFCSSFFIDQVAEAVRAQPKKKRKRKRLKKRKLILAEEWICLEAMVTVVTTRVEQAIHETNACHFQGVLLTCLELPLDGWGLCCVDLVVDACTAGL